MNEIRNRSVASLVIKGYSLNAVGHIFSISGTWVRIVTIRECLKRLGKEFIRRGGTFYLVDSRYPSAPSIGVPWLRKHYKNRLIAMLDKEDINGFY